MDPLAPLIDALQADGRLRIWSLVITVFGDSVQHRGGRIATQRLGRILGRIGVEPGALRTALSRLARDGWVAGDRRGRISLYRLTPLGLDTFGPASARIYAAPRRTPVTFWYFDANPNAAGLAIAGGRLRPAGDIVPKDDGFRITGTLSPQARRAVANALPAPHLEALQLMSRDLRVLSALPADDPLTALAARTLLIHRWRRLVLRWPEVPPEVMPDTIHPADIHSSVARHYCRLSPAAEAWLDRGSADMAAMPFADPDFARRFGGAQIA